MATVRQVAGDWGLSGKMGHLAGLGKYTLLTRRVCQKLENDTD